MENKRIYKARLDFYYKLLVIYFMFLVVYLLIKGNFGTKEFTIVIHDPILYITFFFILYTSVILIVNMIKGKEIEFMNDKIILKNRFRTKVILYSDIISIKFSKEKERFNDNKSTVRRIRIKLLNRKRLMRIRLSEFYDEIKLINEFKSVQKFIVKKV